VTQTGLNWQSKLVLLIVLPFAAAYVVLQSPWWAAQAPAVAIWTLGLSAIIALATWKLRAATAGAAFTGAAITASLMFSTANFPYEPLHTALTPVLAVAVLAYAATRAGRERKEALGIAEQRHGRTASQVAANLGMAALACSGPAQSLLVNSHWLARAAADPMLPLAVALAALAEAAADTVSSEMGQVLGGRPFLITTLRRVEPGRDGAISLAGTLAGAAAAAVVAGAGAWALRGGLPMFAAGCAGGLFGLFFDSLLGATLEERGWLNNDAVNFLSTASAAACALVLLALRQRFF